MPFWNDLYSNFMNPFIKPIDHFLQVVNDSNSIGFVPSNYVRKESIVDKAKGTIKGLARGRNRSSDPEPVSVSLF